MVYINHFNFGNMQYLFLHFFFLDNVIIVVICNIMNYWLPLLRVDHDVLVGGLEHEFYFSIYWEESFHPTFIFSEGFKPPTSYGILRVDHDIAYG